jgi:hypothetical protein
MFGVLDARDHPFLTVWKLWLVLVWYLDLHCSRTNLKSGAFITCYIAKGITDGYYCRSTQLQTCHYSIKLWILQINIGRDKWALMNLLMAITKSSFSFEHKHVTVDLLVLLLVGQIWQSQFLGVQLLQDLFITPMTKLMLNWVCILTLAM